MKIICFAALLMLCACTTAEVARSPQPQSQSATLDLQEIKTRLNMNRGPTELGFQEKKYDPCDYGRRGDVQCREDYVTTVHFQLLCRMSEGTVDTVSRAELYPVRSNSIQFRLGNMTGVTKTDSNGYGQIEVVRPRSARSERLRLTIEDRFVATPASEINRLVVPENWCRL